MKIRTYEDFPSEGIKFYDISPMLGDPDSFRDTVEELSKPLDGKIDKVVAFDARGFIFGAAMATRLSVGLVLLRKSGKLPGETYQDSYDLEYGKNSLEIQSDAINPNEKVVLVDDVIATGGTALAGINLVNKCGGDIVEFCSVIDLPALGGSERITDAGIIVRSLISLGD